MKNIIIELIISMKNSKANQMENRWSKTKDLRNELAAATAACGTLLFFFFFFCLCFFFNIFDFWLIIEGNRSVKRLGEVAQHVACHMPWVFFSVLFLVSYSRLSHARDFGQVKRAKRAKEREGKRGKMGVWERENASMAYPCTGGASWLPLHAAARPKPQPQQLQKKGCRNKS